MKKELIILIMIIAVQSIAVNGQEYHMPLYKNAIPDSKISGIAEIIERTDIIIFRNVQVPEISVYLPAKRFTTGQCVIICPGGGYWQLSYDLEGTDIARYFNSIGVAAVVLKYRLPSKDYCIEPHKAPLMDAQRAMRLVRFNAAKWNIDPDKIGIMGFSAGGHLASTLGTHFDYGNKLAADSVERQSCRPDFMILMYPVISLADSVTHKGSKKSLLGEDPDKKLVSWYSNELQVRDDTPPTFLVHADNDTAVPVENSLLMYNALHKKNIQAELHILSEGDHGFGLGIDNKHVSSWLNNLKLWLDTINKEK